MTRPSEAAPSGTAPGDYGSEIDSKTILSSTSTITNVVTVYPAESSAPATPTNVYPTNEENSDDESGNGSNDGGNYGSDDGSDDGDYESGNGYDHGDYESGNGSDNGDYESGNGSDDGDYESGNGSDSGSSSTADSGSGASETCVPGTTSTVTEKETVYVTLTPTASSTNDVQPIQSSSAPYYPTGGDNTSGMPAPTGYAPSSGFMTSYKPKSTGVAQPTGDYSFVSSSAAVSSVESAVPTDSYAAPPSYETAPAASSAAPVESAAPSDGYQAPPSYNAPGGYGRRR